MVSKEWKKYLEDELEKIIENLTNIQKYILSEVESKMINEGKNSNLLLIFENDEKRDDFIKMELRNIEGKIADEFGENVMIFKTILNPVKWRF
jgi:hypothetical protein